LTVDQDGIAVGAAERGVLRCNFNSFFGLKFFEGFEGFGINDL